MSNTRVAVIGGGIAGIGAAYTLTKGGASVSIFEENPHLGGHCFGVPVSLGNGKNILIDAGVSDFNINRFHSVKSLVEELGLEYFPVCQDASFMTPDRKTSWYSKNGEKRFVNGNIESQTLLKEITRFSLDCVEVLSEPAYADWSLKKYLDERLYSQQFRELFLFPRAAGSFPMPDEDPNDYKVRTIVAFWHMHGIVGTTEKAQRMTIRGGMFNYCLQLERWLTQRGADVKLGTRVVGISRQDGKVRVRAVDPAQKNITEVFDHVIVAANCNLVLQLFEDVSQEEVTVFRSLPWQRARLVVHQDERLMPSDRSTWGAYNYLIAKDDLPKTRPTITFYPNLLASLDKSVPDVFVTMNPFLEPGPERIIANKFFIHPAIRGHADISRKRLERLQGQKNTWFCGSYTREPHVHEQALQSGIDIATALLEQGKGRAPKTHNHSTVSFDDFLRSISLFSGLDTAVLDDLQILAKPVRFEEGTFLFRQGEAADGMYLVVSGQIQVRVNVPGGETKEVATIGPGSIVGEIGLLDDGPRSADALVEKSFTGYFMSYNRFDAMRKELEFSAFALLDRFSKLVATRCRELLNQLILKASPGEETNSTPPTPCFANLKGLPSGIPFLKELSPSDIELLSKMTRGVSVRRGTSLIAQFSTPNRMYFVVRGAVAATFYDGEKNHQVSIQGPGHWIGQLGFIDRLPQCLEHVATENSILLEVDSMEFERIRQGQAPLTFKFIEAIAFDTVKTLRKINALAVRLSTSVRVDQNNEVSMDWKDAQKQAA